ncbi:hypothetical protein [Bacillus safensis]|uniref:Type II secretion system protein GspF domain-containing protein n=1 Tax=Bacillus safensis TaxID=561879 RepID=A0A1L6ZP77_BACIA|nr:hypothetical protein [Bacillus safensis]APT48319.1 hypothetical protein BSA145_20865 [Bacillus safensis]
MDEAIPKKPSFWMKIAESNLFYMMDEMGLSENQILKFQKARFFKTIIIFILACTVGILINKYFILVALAITIFLWISEYKRVESKYKKFMYQKNLVFNKFSRLLIPYLLEDNASLYDVLEKMRKRIDEGQVKTALEQLLIDMYDDQTDKPFIKFAKEASGTEDAFLFMTTLYDFQQNASDTSIIERLGEKSSEQLFKGVDEIIEFKLKRFLMFPTKLTMATLLIIIGYCVSMIINAVKDINL